MAGSGNWQTPKWLVDLIHRYRGSIDLDPCTTLDNPTRAERALTPADNALGAAHWPLFRDDFVFMNPPFSRGVLNPFIERLLSELNEAEALVLVRQDCTKAMELLLGHSSGVLIPHMRIHYTDPETGQPAKNVNFGSWLVHINGDPLAFANHFVRKETLGFYFRKW